MSFWFHVFINNPNDFVKTLDIQSVLFIGKKIYYLENKCMDYHKFYSIHRF